MTPECRRILIDEEDEVIICLWMDCLLKGESDRVQYVPEVQESNCRTSEMGFQTEEESPHLEPEVQPRTDADEDIPSCRDKKDNYGRQGRAGSATDFPSGEHS